MNQSNFTFKHPERAPYEFSLLLRSLPRHLDAEALSANQLDEVDAANLHATNCQATLLTGLQSLGRVLWSAAFNEQQPVGSADCARVGQLVAEIALQIEFLSDFREEVAEHHIRIAQKGSGK